MSPLLNTKTGSLIHALIEKILSELHSLPTEAKKIIIYICKMITTVLLIFALIIFLIFLIILTNPNLPTVKLESVNVTSLNTTVNLTATFNLTFVFQNPNKKHTITYNNLVANITWYGDDNIITLATMKFSPFTQETKSVIKVRAELTMVSNRNNVVKGIAAERASGMVNFGVSLLGIVKFKKGVTDFITKDLRVECDRVVILFLNGRTNGTLMDPSFCSVG